MENGLSCRGFIERILKYRGGSWRTSELSNRIFRDYRKRFQHNTIAKNLSFMKRDGVVESVMVETRSGVHCCEYWWRG